MRSVEDIMALFKIRKDDPLERWRTEAAVVQRLMDGDIWAPVSERLGEEEYAAAANLAVIHLDQLVNRIVSTKPNVTFKPIRQTDPSKEKARDRRTASLAFWNQNKVEMLDRKRVRQLRGYGQAPMRIGPHPKLSIPKWTYNDALMTYPAHCDEQTSYTPDDCIYAYKRSYGFLKRQYPGAIADFLSQRNKNAKRLSDDTMLDVVEYIDDTERVLILTHSDSGNVYSVDTAKVVNQELDRTENLLGVCPVVVPKLININRLKSPYVDNIGFYIMRNKLAALNFLYAEKTVFPETNFIEPPGSPNGEIVQMPDAVNGIIGHMRGGQLVTTPMPNNFTGTQQLDRLEEQERVSNSTPSEWSGQSASNIRTAVRGNNIASAAVDFTIQETQEILSIAKEQELRLAIKVDKTYYNRPKPFFVGWDNSLAKSGKPDYTPKDLWESDEMSVFYSATGMDASQQVISGGQRIAQGTMSRETFMELDPLVSDPEVEKDRVTAEKLRDAGFMQLLQPGALDPVAMAMLAKEVQSGKSEWWEALLKVHDERQQAQATSGAPGEPTGPVDPNSPAAQPGLAPAAAAGISGPNNDQANLQQLLGALRRPQMQVNGA